MSSPELMKVLVIGLDLGDGALIRQWADRGELPHFADLIREGTMVELGTTAEALHVSAWPTLYTGTGPAQHGVYYTFQPAPGLQGYRRFGAGQYGRPTFWRLLGDAGVRCAVIDAPYTHPEAGPNVAQVIDWGAWAHYWKTDAVPRSLLGHLRRGVGSYPVGLEAHDLGLVGLDPDDLGPRLVAGARAKTEATLALMGRDHWDCLVTVYGETHAGSHYCWWPSPDGATDRSDLSALLALYRAIDEGIGRIVAALPPDATVFVVSGDGVGPNRSGWHLLPDVLRRLGLLAEPQSAGDAGPAAEGSGEDARSQPGDVAGSQRGEDASGRPGFDPVKALRDLLPKDFRKALARRLPTRLRDALARRVDTAGIDWSRTRAFTLPTDLEGLVRVNLRGREPQGIVEPGREYDQLCEELTVALLELVNPATGKAAVREVIRTDRDLDGPRRDYLPDLVVQWAADAPIRALSSDRIGSVSGESPDGRTGTHVPPGFLIARGPGIGEASLTGDAHARDLAPTVLALFGVERPAYMEGRSLVEPPVASVREEQTQ